MREQYGGPQQLTCQLLVSLSTIYREEMSGGTERKRVILQRIGTKTTNPIHQDDSLVHECPRSTPPRLTSQPQDCNTCQSKVPAYRGYCTHQVNHYWITSMRLPPHGKTCLQRPHNFNQFSATPVTSPPDNHVRTHTKTKE